MTTTNKLLKKIRFDKKEKAFTVSQPLKFKDTEMSVQEIQAFLAPIRDPMISASKGNGFIEFEEFISVFVIRLDGRSDCEKVLCFLPGLVSSLTVIPMIALYVLYFLFIVPFWLCCCMNCNDKEKAEAKVKLDQFFEEAIKTFKPKDLQWVYEPEFHEVLVYGVLRGEEAERELEHRRKLAEIRARNEEMQRQEDENQRRRNMMMIMAVGNMMNNEIHKFQESVENINERNRTIIDMANISYANELQRQQQQSHSVRESMGQTTGRGSITGPTTGTTTGTKGERTEMGIFKVSGWGCDALFQKTNGTVTRCNSKGDPSNQGGFLVVQTTSKPMSIRFESERTWIDVPAQSNTFFVRIPPQLMTEKWITIEAHYTPAY